MKKIVYAAVAASFAIAAAASASTGGNDNGVTDKATGKNAFAYVDAWGPVSCNETKHPKFETVSCNLATPSPDLAGTTITVGWNSDFGGRTGTITLTFSADGSNYSGLATY